MNITCDHTGYHGNRKPDHKLIPKVQTFRGAWDNNIGVEMEHFQFGPDIALDQSSRFFREKWQIIEGWSFTVENGTILVTLFLAHSEVQNGNSCTLRTFQG